MFDGDTGDEIPELSDHLLSYVQDLDPMVAERYVTTADGSLAYASLSRGIA